MNKKILISIISISIIIAVIGAIVILKEENKEPEVLSNADVEEKSSITYNNVEIVPGKEFDEKTIQEEAILSEIPSCAFTGTDKVYTYEGVEVTTALIDETYKVYEIYCINDMTETEKGIKITDTKSDMIEKYGTEYKEELGNRYTYTRNNVELSFTIENEVITGIVYTLNTAI